MTTRAFFKVCHVLIFINTIVEKTYPEITILYQILIIQKAELGRTWQPFVGSKNGNENIRQARNNNFGVKCVVFARNRKFAKLTQ